MSLTTVSFGAAVRRMGELLKQDHDKLSKGTRTKGGGGHSGGTVVLPPEDAPTLASLGVSKRESSEAQKLADLEPEKFDEVLKKTRGERWRSDLGDWYIVNFNSNSLVCGRIDPIDEARERGVLKPYEEVVDVDDEEEVDHVE
jgi:hypothetical protein